MRRVVLAVVLLVWPSVSRAQPPAEQVIVTSGEAVVARAPDRAFITVSVETRAKNPREAQRLAAEAMTAVQQRLTTARIAGDAVRTISYDLQQEFEFVQNRRVPKEFLARNAIEMRLEEIARVGEILDLVVQGGATSVGGVRFDIRDRSGAEREALRLAVADARARAEAAAAGAGRSLDRILRIEDQREGGFEPPRPMMMARAMADVAQTPVEPGTIEVRARVTLTVSMK